MTGWGFKYKTSMFVWHKLKNNKPKKDKDNSHSIEGRFSNPSTEEVLVGIKG